MAGDEACMLGEVSRYGIKQYVHFGSAGRILPAGFYIGFPLVLCGAAQPTAFEYSCCPFNYSPELIHALYPGPCLFQELEVAAGGLGQLGPPPVDTRYPLSERKNSYETVFVPQAGRQQVSELR